MTKRRGLLVVTDPLRAPGLAGIPTCPSDAYLEGKPPTLEEGLTVINLCRSYGYLSKGYYVSLLADARHQRAHPPLPVIEELGNRFAYLRTLREAGIETIDPRAPRKRRGVPKAVVAADAGLRRADPAQPLVLRPARGERGTAEPAEMVEVTSVLGKTLDARFRRQCAAIFRSHPFPLLKIRFYREDGSWKVGRLKTVTIGQIGAAETALLAQQLTEGRFGSRAPHVQAPRHALIACLWDEADPYSPSSRETLERFERVAERRDVLFEVVGKGDLARLFEHDALFIRTVTAVGHYSFAFAQQAESLGMPVIDDPQSILRCSNKVYLHQIFRKSGLPIPRTVTVSRKTPFAELEPLGFPLIVKLPDGTFSSAVKKAGDRGELELITQDMFRRSPLLIVQEYIPTPHDWRIGVLEGQVLWACRYHMVKDHWQIVSRRKDGTARYGRVEAVPIPDVPPEVLRVALEAAALIGDGLYGVDLKEIDGQVALIEVNDNPNIDTGFEDAVEKDRIYEAILATFVRRIQEKAQGRSGEGPDAPA